MMYVIQIIGNSNFSWPYGNHWNHYSSSYLYARCRFGLFL